MRLELRPVSPTDLPDLVELYRRCEAFLRLATDQPIDAAYVQADLDLSLEEGCAFHTIWVEGALAGVADWSEGGYRGRPAYGFINFLMIDPQWRGKGLGRAVVAAIEERVWRNPVVHSLGSAVQIDNPEAIAFWAAVGYATIDGPTLQPDGTTTFLLEKGRPQ